MIENNTALTLITSPVRKIGVEISLTHNGELGYFRSTDRLVSFTIERVGDDSKFFGFGVCQKLNFHLLDKSRELNIKAGDVAQVLMYNADFTQELGSVGSAAPIDYTVTEVHRDEITNEISITAYDAIYEASNYLFNEIEYNFSAESSIKDYAEKAVAMLGLSANINNIEAFNITGLANFGGTESIREVLADIAEATQTIYYCGGNKELIFRRLDIDGAAVYQIDKSRYFTLDSRTSRRLNKLCRATSLGDNVSVELAITGTTQYIRDNAFWDVKAGEELETILNDALEVVGGLTINQFNCSWRGNWLLEPGDKIGLTTKDNDTVISYLLNDTIIYNGAYQHETQWEYANTDTEAADNPASLGEALKITYSKVDKINNEVVIVAATAQEAAEEVSELKLTTDSISTSVQQVKDSTNSAIEGVHSDITALTKRVESTMTAEAVQIEIQEAMNTGVSAVTTTTGFTFNEAGLSVSKSDSEMTTQITEDGMTVSRNNSPMLITNNQGVNAVNLHASTYLTIGKNSRFEDYDDKQRTGCFWIGG